MMNKYELAGFIVRIILGLTFFIHGFAKFQGGISNTVGFFESIGLPGFAAYATASIELVGGIAMILGIGTRIVSVLFAIIMAGALIKIKFAAGFMGSAQMAGYEFELALLAMSIHLAITGSSFFSVDKVLFRSSKEA
ncbi:DoxX family protein [Bacillus chungangensis]|uniref:Membrane protein YphA (DoxX/SURF4 family) n=1 Tax=Bacillus chungangensis TaxID=587633 RepID=A0ABT9WXS5_9BACI|nr:DoxX family protein [Bacillus chungangensis]MDQ0178032.1 putative membrane protein YphA (DoxX/SURF4 family) [Bacillus chungangensis]